MPDAIVLIPARWASTRFPGKPMAMLNGMTLLHRTIATARAGTADRHGTAIAVATDDARIARHAEEAGCAAILTDRNITSGTGRVLAALNSFSGEPSAVLNLQGDNPFASVEAIGLLLDKVIAGAAVATPVIRLTWEELDRLRRHKLVSPFSGTTCVRQGGGRAHWFSKQILPAIRDEAQLRERTAVSPVFRHVGLYCYTPAALRRFDRSAESPNELAEGLEQLRFIDLGIPIETIEVNAPPISMSGIDSPEDLALAASLIDRHGDPHVR